MYVYIQRTTLTITSSRNIRNTASRLIAISMVDDVTAMTSLQQSPQHAQLSVCCYVRLQMSNVLGELIASANFDSGAGQRNTTTDDALLFLSQQQLLETDRTASDVTTSRRRCVIILKVSSRFERVSWRDNSVYIRQRRTTTRRHAASITRRRSFRGVKALQQQQQQQPTVSLRHSVGVSVNCRQCR